MNLGDELLTTAAERDLKRIDEKLFFDIFQPPAPSKRAATGRR
jgi:hypothetical protein